jgi:hypothetical protein
VTSASPAGQLGGSSRFARVLSVALIAGLALIAALAFNAASASAIPPEEPKVELEEISVEYTTAHFVWKTESPYTVQYGTQYTTELGLNPADKYWEFGNGQPLTGVFGTVMEPGTNHIVEDVTGLKPGTEYQLRFVTFGSFGSEEYRDFKHPDSSPYPTFKTKAVAKPSISLNTVTGITLNSAHITGTIETNAPPGPLSAAEKAATSAKWELKCRPSCQFGTGESSGVVPGDEPSHPFSWDTIRLEANTYYEMELIATNADGHQTTVAEEFFTTPNVAPKLTPAPGGSSGKGAYSVGGVISPYNTKITDCHFEYGPTTEYVYSAPCSPQPIGRNEIQKFAIGANDGTFTLTFRGQTTDNIHLGADPEVVEEELQALSVIGPQGVTKVVRAYGFFEINYEVFFGGPLSGTNLNPLRVNNGDPPVFIDGQGIPGCCTGDFLGFAGSIVDGGNNDPVVVEADLTGLTPGATYHYKVFATNNVGTVTTEDIRFVAPPDPADNPCSNEAVRIENKSTRLPECRAYELVTTAFTTGYGASLGQMSINEGTVGYTSLAGNINNSGYGGLFSNAYVAERHADGWDTVANLNGPRGSFYAPPNDIDGFVFAPTAYSSDLKRSLWFLAKKGERRTLWLRQNDGTFVKVHEPSEKPGFFGQEFLYAGATDDLSHVYYQGNEFGEDLWAPGVGPGIYEFEGIGNGHIPRRIDLDNAGNPISSCIGGAVLTGSAFFNRFTADGRIVWFTVGACEGKTDQIWARVDASKSYFASESHCTRTASDPGGACNAAVNPAYEGSSKDGSSVLFTTTQQLLNSDTDETTDLYESVLPTDPNGSPKLFQVSGAAPNAKVRNLVRVSDEGRRVYFMAKGVLASNHDAHDQAPFPGDVNLYVWQRDAAHPDGYTQFVTMLEDPPQNYDVSAFGYVAQISADGRYLVFAAYHPMVETDTDNSMDIYRYDAVTGEMARVSVDTAGVGGNADFTDASLGYRYALSNDGQQVVFTTTEALSPEDGNGGSDAYVWHDGHTSLLSTGSVGGGAGSVFIDGSGDDIYITSGQQLTADDIDEVADVYDIRRGGGYTFEELSPCSGEGCQPASTPAPDNGTPATDGAGGEGNYRPAAISIKALSSSQRAKLAAGGEAELPLKVSGPGKISLTGTARIDKRTSQVIDASSRAVQAGLVRVPITLAQRALSQLHNKGVLSVQLGAVVADSETATATLKLKTAEARRSKKGRG